MSTLQSSPFAHLIEYHGIPCPSQKASIDAFIDSQQRELDATFIEYERLSRLFDECKGKISSLKRSIQCHGGLFSTWRRVPPELWAEIFMFATLPFPSGHEEWEARPGYEDIHLEGEPWVIASVCRKWREIALANPSLWSYVSIFHSRHSCSKGLTPDHPDFLQYQSVSGNHNSFSIALAKQLERSSDANLHVSIYPPCHPRSHERSTLEFLLAPHMHRFQYLEIPPSLLCALHGPYPQLRFISTDKCRRVAQMDIDESALIQGADQLRHLELGCIPLDYDHTAGYNHLRHLKIAFPWSSLETLEIDSLEKYYYFVVGVMPQLEDTIVNMKLNMDPDDPEPIQVEHNRFTFQRLKTLSLGGNTQQCGHLISLLVSPVLDSFSIYDVLDVPRSFIGLINRSQCRLRSLVIVESTQYGRSYWELEDRKPKTARKLLSHEGFCYSLEELDIRGIQGAFPFDVQTWPSESPKPEKGKDPDSDSESLFCNLKRLSLSRREVHREQFVRFVQEVSLRDEDGHLQLEHVKLTETVKIGSSPALGCEEVKSTLKEIRALGVEVETDEDD